jgi:Na+-transporting methylmalonyl-CoA/oxaloacetate decarboxylase gamma subunit
VETGDALTISMLGMAVVFAGLALTALLVFIVARLPQLAARLSAPAPPPRAVPPDAESRSPVDPTVVAVIAAALEVERRLHRAELGRRLTIEPSA